MISGTKEDSMRGKKKREKKAIEEFSKIFDWWCGEMGLKYWLIQVYYVSKLKTDENGYDVIARTYSRWEYREATIYVCLKQIVGISKERMEKIVVHELAHCLVDCGVRGVDKEKKEFTVSSITDAFLWVSSALRRGEKPY